MRNRIRSCATHECAGGYDRERRAKTSVAPNSTNGILALLCVAFLLLQFEEKDFSGWVRLAAIWATALGYCLLAVAIAWRVTQLRKLRTRPSGFQVDLRPL